MTQEDMRQQKANLLLEFDETQQRCAHLYEKLRGIGLRFQEFGQFLARDAIARVYGPSSAHAGFETVPLDGYYQKPLDFAAAVTAADELRAEMRKLDDLEQRTQYLGATVHRTLPRPKKMQF